MHDADIKNAKVEADYAVFGCCATGELNGVHPHHSSQFWAISVSFVPTVSHIVPNPDAFYRDT
jgi:hypothetical protein